MKTIGFIGATDKTDLIIYIAKIVKETGKKVLVIDSTMLGKSRYIVPAVSPSRVYITSFEEIDVAVGFNSIEDIKDYLGVQELDYDMILMDIDSPEEFEMFNAKENDKNYFVTAFDNYSLKRGLEIIGKQEEKVLLTKILISKEMLKEEEDYLNFLSFYYSIQWDKDKIHFPFENGDQSVIIENQRAAKIRFRNLSLDYKTGLEAVAIQILPDVKVNDIRRVMKSI